MNIFKQAIKNLKSVLGDSASITATYAHGSTTYTITVIPAASTAGDIRDLDKVRMTLNERDFIVAVSELENITLQERDTITDDLGDVWQINRLGNETAWRYCDPFCTLVRIHTKKIHG